jgi:hypothetical protein
VGRLGLAGSMTAEWYTMPSKTERARILIPADRSAPALARS